MTPPSQTSAYRSARAARSPQAGARPRPVTQRLPRSRVGWDRKFRALMLVVFGLVGWIGVKAALSMYAAHQQAAQQGALVRGLQAQNHRLEAQKRALKQPATIMRDARQLGMVRSGERAYVVVGPSGN